MYDVSINYWAVLVAAISNMVIGYIWYSKPVFGNIWMSAIGKSESQIKAEYKPVTMLWTYVLAAVIAYVLAHFIQLVGATTLSDALTTTLWAWVGFVLAVMGVNALYQGESSKLLWVNAFYQLVSMLVMAAILVNWA